MDRSKSKSTLNNLECDCNSITKYQDVYDAILEDDDIKLERLLQNSSFRINAPFDFEDEGCIGQYKKHFKLYLPIHLAVATCSPKVVEFMMKRNVNILRVDESGRNLLHNCVISGFYCVDYEDKVCQMIKWLDKKIGCDLMMRLLQEESFDGFRPLEFAAQQGTLNIMTTILHLPGYVTIEMVKGGNIYRMIDVTEYEIGDRHNKSPINMLSYLSSDRLKTPNIQKLLQHPVLMGWVNGKMKSNIFPLTLWIIVRLLMLTTYLLLDNDTSYPFFIFGNQTAQIFCPGLLHFHPGLDFTLAACSVMAGLCSIIIITDIAHAIKWRLEKNNVKMHDLNGRKSLVATTLFYQINQGLYLVLVDLLFIFYVHSIRGQSSETTYPKYLFSILYFARMVIPILMLWSVCYFGQLIPKIGSKIVSLQHMLLDLASFLLVLGLATLFFVHAFEAFAFSNSQGGCIDEFRNPWETMYTLFRMLLNMYDTTSANVHNVSLFQMLHILYILLVGIMVLNFLIAIMSNSASTVAANEDIILTISRLAIVVQLEERLFWFMKKMYKIHRRSGFHFTNGRCYIISVIDKHPMVLSKKKYEFNINYL